MGHTAGTAYAKVLRQETLGEELKAPSTPGAEDTRATKLERWAQKRETI